MNYVKPVYFTTTKNKELDNTFFFIDSDVNMTDRTEDTVITVVINYNHYIIDTNVVSEDSKLDNTKGVFHTTAVVIKVIFCQGQDKVSEVYI